MRCFAFVLLAGIAAYAQNADLLLRNGKIWTGDARTTAIAVTNGRIVALGAEAEKLKAKQTIDLRGRFAMPGFNDAHIHFLEGALGLTKVDLTGICTLPAIQKAIRDYATAHPDAPWITGGGWEYTCFPNLRMPKR